MEAFIETFTMYYGLDWLAMISGLYGVMLIERKSKWGFVAWLIMAVCGCIVATMSLQYGYLAYNAIAIVLYIKSLRTWNQQEDQEFVAAE